MPLTDNGENTCWINIAHTFPNCLFCICKKIDFLLNSSCSFFCLYILSSIWYLWIFSSQGRDLLSTCISCFFFPESSAAEPEVLFIAKKLSNILWKQHSCIWIYMRDLFIHVINMPCVPWTLYWFMPFQQNFFKNCIQLLFFLKNYYFKAIANLFYFPLVLQKARKAFSSLERDTSLG